MNPAALRANLADVPRGATIIVDTHDFTARNLTKAGYDENPLEDGTLEPFAVHEVDLTVADRRGGQGVRADPQGRRPGQEHVRPRAAVVDVRPPDRADDRVPDHPFAAKPTLRDANVTAFRTGWNFGETTEAFAVRYEIKPASMHAGALPQHHRQRRPGLRPDRGRAAVRAAAVPRVVPDHPGLRRPARAVQAQALRRDDVPGRGRDRRRRRGARRGVRRRARRDHDVRPGRRAQGRDHRARRDARAAAAGVRHPARRAEHRAADQDRAGRPAAGDVRAQRRGAGAGRRAALAGRLLRRRARGGPDRGHLPHPGACCCPTAPSPTAPSRGSCPTSADLPGDRPGVRDRPQRGRRRRQPSVPAVPARRRRRWPGRGRCPARRASSTASAAWRRPTAPATSPTTRPTTT